MSKIFKKIGKAIKKVANFVKDNWKKIAVVAAGVFTMGLATVGTLGFTGAMSAAAAGGAGTFGSFMSAIGSTMYAGATAALGSLGIGGGAAGAAATAGGVQGVGLFGGHLAAALGSSSAQAGIASQLAMQGGTAAGSLAGSMAGTGAGISNAFAGGAQVAGTGVGANLGAATGIINPATAASGLAGGAGAAGAAGAGGAGGISSTFGGGTSVGGAGAGGAGATAAKGGFFSSPLTKAALITTGGQMLAGYAQGKMMEQDEDPLRSYWGVDLRTNKQKKKDAKKGLDDMAAPPPLMYAPTPFEPPPPLQSGYQYGDSPYDPYRAPVPQDPGLMDVAYKPPGG